MQDDSTFFQFHSGSGDNIAGDKNVYNLNLPKVSKNIPSDVGSGTPYFVGRIDDLEDLHQKLQQQETSNIVSICAVRGMGGIGKSELATQYALSPLYRQNYTACYWFSLRNGNLAKLILEKTFPYLAMPEELLKQGTIDQQVEWCWQNWHPTEEEILIIIDDVQSLEDIPEKWLPKDARFKVIITTRQRGLSPRFTELPLGVLSEAESWELLRKIVDKGGTNRIDNELETAKEICKRLGYLPLGLELAATYLYEDEMLTLGEYLQQLRIEDESLSDEMVRVIRADRGVIAAFNLSWQKLTGLSTQLAMMLGRFAAADIPWKLLVEPTVKALNWETQGVTKARKQLGNLHLIEIIEQKKIRIHTLLREYYRYHSEKMGEEFIHQVQESFALSCLEIAKSIPQTPVMEDIERVELAIPHLEYLSETMLDEIPDLEDNFAWVFRGIGQFYSGQGKYDLAEVPLERCVEEIEFRLGEESQHYSGSLNNLALLYSSQGRYSEAEPLYIRALSITEQKLGENHPSTATSLNNLALLYTYQGRYSEVESLYIRALSTYEQKLGETHPFTAQILDNLAVLYRLQGRYSEAEPLFIRALSIREQQLGKNHPDTAHILNSLALLYSSQGRYSEAEPLYIRALSITEQKLGENHPDTSMSLNNLALLYSYQGRYSEAEPLYIRALSITEQKLGENHPFTAQILDNLANLYRFQGRYSEAEPLYIRALSIREQELGETHPSTAQSLNNLAGLYLSQGRYSEAEPLYIRALSIYEQQLGENHPDTAGTLNNLANLYLSQGRYGEAEPLYIRALSICEQQLGENHPHTINGMFAVKLLRIMKRLECDQHTLLSILQSIAQENNITELNEQILIQLLEVIESQPQLIEQIRQNINNQTR